MLARKRSEMTPLLTFETGHLFDGPGLAPASCLGPRTERDTECYATFREQLASYAFAFAEAPRSDEGLGRYRELARGRAHYENILILGIGGSTLGFQALLEALRGPLDASLGGRPRFFVLDNVDPGLVGPVLERLDFARTLLVYISKSGSTPESAANFLVCLERLRAAGGRVEDTIFLSDPGDNGMNRLARELGATLVPIPPALGGRFSVLSSVGLVPAALAGLKLESLLAGARQVHAGLCEGETEASPVYRIGRALHHHFHDGRNLHALFTYSSRMAACNRWFVQLWSESLGKRFDLEGNEVRTGMTPLAIVGATDQHSILQLLREGPQDKVVGFIRVEDAGTKVPIPALFPHLPEYAYLGGHDLAEQLEIERVSTEVALLASGTPCYSLSLARLDEACLGAWLYFEEALTAFVAALDGVDAFDQPGVEEGKRMTYALMGREGHAERRPEVEARLAAYRAKDEISTL